MQVLEGGKDNPNFDGQKMFQKLDGTFVPAKEITLPIFQKIFHLK